MDRRPLTRRRFQRDLALVLAASHPLVSHAQPKPLPPGPSSAPSSSREAAPWPTLEAAAAGRLGVAVLDTATGQLAGHRLDERFPMCSTFKWLAAACVLQRVDAGHEQLERRVRFGREVLVPHSPVTAQHTGEGMTLAALCEATITVSDNAAGNLLLQSFGGPEALTRYARTLGDSATRLDRWEPELNEATPGDPRDTTTPRAMATALHATLVGDALSARSRARLTRWMEATRTNTKRLRAGLPPGWRLGSKTGTGDRGTTNDVGVYWPPGRPPLVVAAYLTETEAPLETRQGALAGVARQVTQGA
jgi:beta-lactamase class A